MSSQGAELGAGESVSVESADTPDNRSADPASPGNVRRLLTAVEIGSKTFGLLGAAGAGVAVIAAVFSFVLGTPDLMLTV
jgi:hypothetical protein